MPSMPLKDVNNINMPVSPDSTVNPQCGDSTEIYQPSDATDDDINACSTSER